MQESRETTDTLEGRRSPFTAGRLAAVAAIVVIGGFLAWFLVTSVDFGGGSPLPLGKPLKGRTLIVQIDKLNRVSEVRVFRDTTSHYLVTPSDLANELATLQISVWNDEASIAVLNMEERALEVRGADSEDRFTMLEVCAAGADLQARDDCAANSENVRIVPGGISEQANRYPQGFLAGVIEIPEGRGLDGGWAVFEVPKELEIERVRWGAGGDVIFFP